MSVSATIASLPRARLYIFDSYGNPVDCGRYEDATVTSDGPLVAVEEFSQSACIKYVSRFDQPTVTGKLSGTLVSGTAYNRGLCLLADLQQIGATTFTKTTAGTLSAGSLVYVGASPAGATSGGVFTPSALATAEDDDDPANSLTLGTHYAWQDGRNGLIEILDVTGLTQPLTFAGNTRATTRAVINDGAGDFKRLLLLGVDQRNQCTGHKIELWMAVADVGQQLPISVALNSDEAIKIPAAFTLYPDPTRAATTTLGPLGYFEQG